MTQLPSGAQAARNTGSPGAQMFSKARRQAGWPLSEIWQQSINPGVWVGVRVMVGVDERVGVLVIVGVWVIVGVSVKVHVGLGVAVTVGVRVTV